MTLCIPVEIISTFRRDLLLNFSLSYPEDEGSVLIRDVLVGVVILCIFGLKNNPLNS
jgi:hypothetical protein